MRLSARSALLAPVIGVVTLAEPAGAQGPSPDGRPGAAPRAPTILWKVPLKSTSFGGAAVADADGDGGLDVAFGTYFGDGSVRVLRGRDGSELWKYTPERDACVDASMKFADVDGDGKLELVAPISNLSRVVAFDAATGRVKWVCQLPVAECIDTPPWIGPMSGPVDGPVMGDPARGGAPATGAALGLGVMVGTFAGNVHLIDGRDGKDVRTLKAAPGAVQSCPVLTDLDGDGVLDVIVGNFNGDHKVHAASGRDGAELWTVATGSHIYHGPAVGDLDGDGADEFVIASYDGKVYAFGRDGKTLWTVSPGDRYFMAPVALVDLDGDGRPESVCTSQRVTAIHPDGTVMWSVPADGTGGMDSTTRGVSVADLDGDGEPDLAYLTGSGLFRVLRGRDGGVIYELDVAKAVGVRCEQSSHGPVIADLDGDGRFDVFLVVGNTGKDTRTGMGVALTGFSGKAGPGGGGPGWPMFRHDLRNTGNAATR
jgi:outer membrane protein assembly factor BamB